MSTSSAPHVERFKGASWEECNEFILALRTRALWEGKQRDSAWMADFAATHFWQKAMSWHCRLPQDVRQDWLKLEIALVDRWPPPEDDDEPEIKPTPAAAPSLIRDDKVDCPLQGALKVVLDGSNTNYYLQFNGAALFLTTDSKEAVRVRCISLCSTTLLELIDHSSPSLLAVHWHASKPTLGNGSTDHALISCVDLRTAKSSWSNDGPLQLMTWTVLADGEVTLVWKKDDSSKITLYPFAYGDGYYLYLTADAEACGRKEKLLKRAKFFFEPID